jgi:hypothetical protein
MAVVAAIAVVAAVLWDLSAVLVYVLLSDSVVGSQSAAAAAVTMRITTNPLAYTSQQCKLFSCAAAVIVGVQALLIRNTHVVRCHTVTTSIALQKPAVNFKHQTQTSQAA